MVPEMLCHYGKFKGAGNLEWCGNSKGCGNCEWYGNSGNDMVTENAMPLW